ncbi:polyketide synthase dehydratase domain-containing protein, partial [Frankia sp. AiPs1]|uniref:acyltransferase domain-containing protein n=1 Tax=Frankia sp. AiPs1 TaxID=573493 RepID=UPI002044AE76
LTPADGARVICRRSRLLTRIAGAGAMATVALDPDKVDAELAANGGGGEVSIAVLAAPGSTVVAGAARRVDELVAHWTERGIPTHRIAVDVASHCPQVDALLPELTHELAQLQPVSPRLRFYSTVAEQPGAVPAFDADYWAANLRRPVRFAAAVRAAAADGHRVFIEVSPQPVVTRSITDTLADSRREPVVLPTLRRDEDGRGIFRAQLAAAHCVGVPVDWSALYPTGALVDLPPLTLDRRRHWVTESASTHGAPTPVPTPGSPSTSAAGDGVAGDSAAGDGVAGDGLPRPGSPPLPGTHTEIPGGQVRHLWRADVGTSAVPWLADHRVNGRAVLPGAAYSALALTVAGQAFGAEPHHLRVTDIAFEDLLVLDAHTDLTVTVTPQGSDQARCEIFNRGGGTGGDDGWVRHSVATLHRAHEPALAPGPPGGDGTPTGRPVHAGDSLAARAAAHPHPCDVRRLREDLLARGIDHGPAFAALTGLHLSADGRSVWAALAIPTAATTIPHALSVHPVLLDACAQALLACLPAVLGGVEGLILPAGVGEIRLLGDPSTARYCHGRLERADVGVLHGEADLLAADGTPVARIEGLRYLHRDVRPDAASPPDPAGPNRVADDWLYRLEWQPAPRPAPTDGQRSAPARWLVLGDA